MLKAAPRLSNLSMFELTISLVLKKKHAHFPDDSKIWHKQRKNLRINELISMAIDTLKLRSVKDIKQKDITNSYRYAVLTPLTTRIEGPEHYTVPPTRTDLHEQETIQKDKTDQTQNPPASSPTNSIVMVNDPDTPPKKHSSDNISTDETYNKIQIDELFIKNTYNNRKSMIFSTNIIL